MKFKLIIIFELLLVLVFCFSVNALATDQEVTINVDSINELTLSCSQIILDITSATAGSGPDDDVDTSSTMSYTTNGSNKKITAQLGGTYAEGITLYVEVDSDSGQSAGLVELGTTAQDVITGLSNASDQAQQITYTASATVDAAPTSGISQTVTYTITDG